MLPRLLAVAVLAGTLTGLASTLVQELWAVPLILEAETYEGAVLREGGGAAAAHGGPEHSGTRPPRGHHEGEAGGWGLAAGLERTVWTAVANVGLGIGAALIICAALLFRARATYRTGLLLGLIGFLSFSVAPSLGLPPELPGTAAAELADRQLWWFLTAGATATGLALMLFARGAGGWPRLAGLMVLLIPHLVGAPYPEVHESSAPEALRSEFVVASLTTAGFFWLALGAVTGLLFTWLRVRTNALSHPRRAESRAGT